LHEAVKTNVTPENQAKRNYNKPTEFSQCKHNQTKEHQQLSVTMAVTSTAEKASFEVALCILKARKPKLVRHLQYSWMTQLMLQISQYLLFMYILLILLLNCLRKSLC
jgi:hypothetical protein